MIVSDVDRSPGENQASEAVEAATIADDTDCVPKTTDVQESTNPEPDSSCIVRVVIGSSEAAMEEAVSTNQSLGRVEAAESFSVPEVLQETHLVSETYESSMDMEGVVENQRERPEA